jgi:hypothetical protein
MILKAYELLIGLVTVILFDLHFGLEIFKLFEGVL